MLGEEEDRVEERKGTCTPVRASEIIIIMTLITFFNAIGVAKQEQTIPSKSGDGLNSSQLKVVYKQAQARSQGGVRWVWMNPPFRM